MLLLYGNNPDHGSAPPRFSQSTPLQCSILFLE